MEDDGDDSDNSSDGDDSNSCSSEAEPDSGNSAPSQLFLDLSNARLPERIVPLSAWENWEQDAEFDSKLRGKALDKMLSEWQQILWDEMPTMDAQLYQFLLAEAAKGTTPEAASEKLSKKAWRRAFKAHDKPEDETQFLWAFEEGSRERMANGESVFDNYCRGVWYGARKRKDHNTDDEAAGAAAAAATPSTTSKSQLRSRSKGPTAFSATAAASSAAPRGKHRNYLRKPDFYLNSIGRRVVRPAHLLGESDTDYQRRYQAWARAGRAVWTDEELAAAQTAKRTRDSSRRCADDAEEPDDEEPDENAHTAPAASSSAAAAAAAAFQPRKQNGRARSRQAASEDESELSDESGEEDEENDSEEYRTAGSAPSSSARNLVRSIAHRSLPDSYVDPKTGLVMVRPVRNVIENESEAAWKKRYHAWRHRGITIGAPGFERAATSRKRSKRAPSNPQEMMSMLSQFVASFNSNQAAAAGAAAQAFPILHAPVPAGGAGASVRAAPTEDVMSEGEKPDSAADASDMPVLGSHSWAAQSSQTQQAGQVAFVGAGVAPLEALPLAVAAGASGTNLPVNGKRKAGAADPSSCADDIAAHSSAAATASSSTASADLSSGSASQASKKQRVSAIPVLQPMNSAAKHTLPQLAAPASSSVPKTADRLSATSSLDLILAECIPDPSLRKTILGKFKSELITLKDLESDPDLYFPTGGPSLLVEYRVMQAGPCIKLQKILRERRALKADLSDEDCLVVDGPPRAQVIKHEFEPNSAAATAGK